MQPTSQKIDPVLIVDNDLDYVGSIRMDPQARLHPPVIATHEAGASLLLTKPGAVYSGIFISPEISEPHGISLIRLAMKHFPAVPLFFISRDAKLGLSEDDLRYMNIRRVFKKPVLYSDMLRAARDCRDLFDTEAAVKQAAANTDVLDKTSELNPSDFVPINARQFVSGSSSLFDLYVRVPNQRHLKIVQCGDRFDAERVNQYINKGVEHFYIRKEAQQNYLKYCDHLSSVLIKKRGVPEAVKLGFVLSQGQQTVALLRNSGVTEESLRFAARYVDRVREVATDLQPHRNPCLKSLLSDAVLCDHGVAVTMVASVMLQVMTFDSERSFHIVGLACLLHDIGLQEMPEHFKLEDESSLTDKELLVFQTHPGVGARMLAGVRGIDPTVVQAVLQHHERRDRQGFPARLGGGSINRVSEIVAISDEYVRLLKLAADGKVIDPTAQMERKVLPRFSAGIGEVFKSVFIRPKAKEGDRT